jgi:hypothetical protein
VSVGDVLIGETLVEGGDRGCGLVIVEAHLHWTPAAVTRS